ncbi:MAG: MBL fold metallo-hydrolase [candidate division Zixibacteria bacterium]|nr:MBL fold metallo-hydrolase [candidate division Zixibacteria bacterium]
MSSFCIHVLNVGHGDSIILELPDNNWGLVDCFKTNAEIEPPALTFLKARNVKKLKFVCLTHPHYDHCRGMLDILEYFTSGEREIEYFWDFGIDKKKLKYFKNGFGSEKEYRELLSLYDFILKKVAEDKRIKYRILGEGTDCSNCLDIESLRIKSYAPISTDILSYFEKWGKDKTIDENLLSIVLVIIYGDTNIVLGADTKSWEEILKAWSEDCKDARRKPKFHFVKVSHHGSKHGNHKGLWKSFIERKKSVAVISTGCKYGSPHKETITSIISSKAKPYSTNFRDFSKPVSRGSLEEYQEKRFISQSLLEALEVSTLPVEDFEIIAPYHGNCSTTVKDNCECLVSPQFDRPPIS